MQSFERILEGCAQFVEECRLAGKDSIASARWSFDYAKKSIRWGIDFEGMIRVIFSSEVIVLTDIPVEN